ncbi:MAG: hypothetical protein ACI86L_000744 [Dokdonia sp.]|jgi:hypothetical protein
MKKYLAIIIFVCCAFAKADIQASTMAAAQCAMCRAVLESEEDNSTAKGVNNGIKYLMVIPYLLVGGVFYAIYHSRKKDQKVQEQQ